MSPILTTIILLIFSLFTLDSNASETVALSEVVEKENLGYRIDFYKDKSHQITIDDIRNSSPKIVWQRHMSETPSMGYSSSTYWFKFTVENSQRETSTHLLEIGYSMLNSVEFYKVVDGNVMEHQVSGNQYPFSQREIPHRNFIFEVKIQPNSSADIYLKVRSGSSIQVPLTLSPTHLYYSADQSELINKSIYYGMMLVMILYNLFLLFSLREIVYLYYVLFIFTLTFVQFSLHGLASQYIWSNFPDFQSFSIIFLVPCCTLFGCLFTRKFLNLEHTSPNMNKAFIGIAIVSILNTIGSFSLNYSNSIKISIFSVLIASSVCLFIGPYLWSRGYQYARYYSIAWLCITLSAAALALSKFGILPRTYLTENGLQIGAAAEAVLLSLALADRLNRERKERFAAEEKLVFGALHHPITKVPNRAFLVNWLENGKNMPTNRQRTKLALFHLNRFHEVNKTLGHQKADEFLKIITSRFNNMVKSIPGVVRLEETEQQDFYVSALEGVSFAIVIDTKKTENALSIVNRFVSKVVEPIEFEGMLITVGGVAGVAGYSRQYIDGSKLIRHAQIALDQGKSVGAPVMEYSEDINPYNERRLTLAGELRHAMLRNDLELYFQPKIKVKTNSVDSMEALLRWNHPEHGFIPPDEFIPIAEQAGLINSLTIWVIDTALDRVAQLDKRGLVLSVAVNISAINLKDKQFPELVKQMLVKYNVAPCQLSLEVTETAMMDDPDQALDILKKLNSYDIRISIDDFGTGYSSLAYIKQLPVQEIKIDRSFVMEMSKSKSDAIIVQTTVNMCHDLSLEVVAEGVETEDVSGVLQGMGCDFLQGYHFSRPLPFEQLVTWLDSRNNDDSAA